MVLAGIILEIENEIQSIKHGIERDILKITNNERGIRKIN